MTDRWLCSSCHSLNDATAKSCYRCRTPRATGEYRDTSGAANAPGLTARPPRDPSLVGGILGGLVVGIPITAVWVWFDFQGSYRFFTMSWLVGTAIALGVVIGGRGRTSFVLVLFSVLLTVLALVVGEYLIVSRVLADEAGVAAGQIAVAQPEDVADAYPRLLGGAPLRPILWVVALIAAWGVPWARLVGPSPDRRRAER